MASKPIIVDEDLVLRIRCGSASALKELFDRYFVYRYQLGNKVAFEIMNYISDSEFNALYSRTLTASINSFQMGCGRFLNYFLFILKREMYKEYNKKGISKDALPSSISLSTPLGDGNIKLEDVMGENNNKVSKKLNEDDAIQIMELFPKRYSKAIEIFDLKLIGFTFAEACREIGSTYSTSLYTYKIFIDLIKFFLSEGSKYVGDQKSFKNAFEEKELELREVYCKYKHKKKVRKKRN